MGFSWISPLYLVGLLLLAIPVLIHLLQKHREDGAKFPSLMFLQQITLHEKRRLEIRHWWLLLLRCLLLLLIVLAFARPFLDGVNESAGLNQGSRDSVIVIDRSYSMRLDDDWRRAQDIATRLVDYKATQDRIAVIVFDDSTELVSDFTADTGKLRSIIKRQQAGLKSTRLRPGLEQAARLLSASHAVEKRIFLISDFRAVIDDVPVISDDIQLETFVVDGGASANIGISALSIIPSANGDYALEVDVSNNAVEDLEQPISLSVNGREQSRKTLRLQVDGVVTETFDGLSASANLLRGVVSLEDDDFSLDNRAYYIYSGKRQVPVLIVEGSQPRVNQFLYLENALRLSRNPGFRVTRLPWRELNAEDLATWAVIIINDVAIPQGELGVALQQFVDAGGGLLVATGETDQRNWLEFMPGSLLSRTDTKAGESLGLPALSADHIAGNSIDVSGTRVFSYRKLETSADERVLARYSDGGVALVEKRPGAGRVLVLTTTLDMIWNDLAVQPGFLPFLHQALNYLSAYESYPDRFEVGELVDVLAYARAVAGAEAINAAVDNLPLIVETPDGSEIQLHRQAPLLELTEPGFYQIHRATPAGVDVVLAANINPLEANLERLDDERFVAEIGASAVPPATGPVLTQRQAVAYEQQQQLWYAILILVLVIMLVEAFSANWIIRKRSVEG